MSIRRRAIIWMLAAAITGTPALVAAQDTNAVSPILAGDDSPMLAADNGVADVSTASLFEATEGRPALLAQIEKPSGPPPTPEHTGLRALGINVLHDFAHLPSKENLFWVGVGTGAALALHPWDDNVNRHFLGNGSIDAVFIPGKYVGQTYTLLGTSLAIYGIGRFNGDKKISHVGMDLLRALIVDYTITEGIKYATHRERPDHSNFKSFPSGHASTTFAFATALERHLGWKYVVPAYAFSSYVAVSRLHDNRHYLSDVAFGACIGVIAGRTVTRHGSSDYTWTVAPTHGGAMVMVAKLGRP